MSVSEHISTACSFGASMATNNKWTVAGEWTGAMTDCALLHIQTPDEHKLTALF